MISLLNYILEIIHRVIHNDLKIRRIRKEQTMVTTRLNPMAVPPRGSEPIKQTSNKLDKRNKEELINVIKAMSPEEQKVIADIIPVELCLARIHKELDEAMQFRRDISNLMVGSMLGKELAK